MSAEKFVLDTSIDDGHVIAPNRVETGGSIFAITLRDRSANTRTVTIDRLTLRDVPTYKAFLGTFVDADSSLDAPEITFWTRVGNSPWVGHSLSLGNFSLTRATQSTDWVLDEPYVQSFYVKFATEAGLAAPTITSRSIVSKTSAQLSFVNPTSGTLSNASRYVRTIMGIVETPLSYVFERDKLLVAPQRYDLIGVEGVMPVVINGHNINVLATAAFEPMLVTKLNQNITTSSAKGSYVVDIGTVYTRLSFAKLSFSLVPNARSFTLAIVPSGMSVTRDIFGRVLVRPIHYDAAGSFALGNVEVSS